MTRKSPIACTLSASARSGREAEIRVLGRDGLVDCAFEDGRAVLRFRPDPEIADRVAGIVAAESECCAFLELRLDYPGDAVVLTITAPNGGAEMVRELAAAFSGR